MEKKPSSHITKAVIIAGIMIAWILLAGKLNIPLAGNLQFVPYVVLTLGIVISCLLFARQMNGAVKFGEVFAHGFKTTAVIALLMAVFTFFAVKYIYPPPTQADIEASIKTVQEQNNIMPNEAREMVLEGEKKQWIIFVSSAIFTTLISGLVGALAGGAIAQKNQ
jgi:hypothetical protein